ncbi:hypothetical protein DS885_08740 [Psychromonas sp. B3M02]|uniref:RCC1 domain-containing protein n=1 Tax=Psychromonas sp. B3M02 TaxID=2267226 RepID=UPI000DEAE34C|nr:hypothetical protein [Psychromonas sp. B3M02]RBW46344.1 hypothetical protein DS885_08740 [Psychromonas sp. B3M02]
MKLTKVLALSASVALTTACNEDSTDSVELSDVMNGQLEVAVSGLAYSTDTLSGTTDESGSFEYRDGETITFSLAGYSLSEVVADSSITISDLVEESSARQTQSIKLLKMMLALDDDGDIYNGLSLDTSVLSDDNADFIEIDETDFEQATSAVSNATAFAYAKTMNLGSYTTLSAGNHHTLGLTVAGKPFSFGENYGGVVYDESPSRYCGSELRLKLGRESDTDLEPGTELNEEGNDSLSDEENACYIEGNIARQYGLYNASSGWVTLSDDSLSFKRISTDQTDGAMVTEDGRLFVFGANTVGGLGLSHTDPVTFPTEVLLPNDDLATYATSGSANTYVVTRSGNVYSSGDNGNLQLGRLDDSSDDQSTFGLVLISEVIVDLAVRDHTVYALTEDGDVYSWGNNSSKGELGDGSVSVDRSTPLKILEGKNIVAIEAGADFGLAVDNEGVVYGWGNNSYGALAQGTPELSGSIYKVSDVESVLIPEVIDNLSTGSEALGSDRIIAFQGGSRNARALTEAGDIYSWGDMGTGYMGNGYETDSSGIERQISVEAVKNTTLDDHFIVTMSANTSSHFAVTEDNTVYAWGSGSDGRLAVEQDECAETNISLYDGTASSTVCYSPIEIDVTP